MACIGPDHQLGGGEQPGHLLQPSAGDQHVLRSPQDGGGNAEARQFGLHVPSMQGLEESDHGLGRQPRRVRQQRLGHGGLERSGRHHLGQRPAQHPPVGSQRAVHPVAGAKRGHRGAVVGIDPAQEPGSRRGPVAHRGQSRGRRRCGKREASHARLVTDLRERQSADLPPRIAGASGVLLPTHDHAGSAVSFPTDDESIRATLP